MKSISSYSLSELLEIKEIIENEELRKKVYQEIQQKNSMKGINFEQYSSARLPEFYDVYRDHCLKIFNQLNFTDVSFLMNRACRENANNCGGDFKFQQFQVYQESYTSMQRMDSFFLEDSRNIYYYEGVYNAINYIKTYISTMLYHNQKIENKDDLFRDFEEKKKLVTTNLKDISEYLLRIRTEVMDSRLCIGNHALSKNANKSGEFLSKNQLYFISSIAFGSTLEKLKEENYEEAARLLFVPQCKVLKK